MTDTDRMILMNQAMILTALDILLGKHPAISGEEKSQIHDAIVRTTGAIFRVVIPEEGEKDDPKASV